MRILIDVTHPAHVHFFKGAAKIWKQHGHEVRFVAREKEITTQLLNEYVIPFETLSKIRKGLLGLSIELIEHQANLLRIIKEFRPDVILNIGGTFVVHVGRLKGIKTCVFTDTEHAKLANSITFPFASYICTPESFSMDLGKTHFRYNGYQELAYLHPQHFKPNLATLDHLELEPETYFVLRFVSWGASHDVGQRGLSDNEKIQLVEGLISRGRVLITSEGELPKGLESYKMSINPIYIHDLLYFAKMYIGEGATMATEAAILGTPSIYLNPLGSGNMSEIIHKYQLMYHFTDTPIPIDKILDFVDDKTLKSTHKGRLEHLLEDKIDVTQWMVKFVEQMRV